MSAMSEARDRLREARAELQARIDAIDAALEALGGPPLAKEPTTTTFAARLYDLLRSNAGRNYTIRDAAAALNFRYVTAASLLAKMATDGLITRTAPGTYRYGGNEDVIGDYSGLALDWNEE